MSLTAIAGAPLTGVFNGTTDARGQLEVVLPPGPVRLTVSKGQLEANLSLNVSPGGTAPALVQLA